MIRDAAVTIKRYNLLEQGDRLLAAVSGGADSVALLSFLREYCPARGIALEALHLNHRLRGAESERDEAFVRALCEAWGIPLSVRGEAVDQFARQNGLSIEEAGRVCRYRFFAEEAAARGAKVATAHTLDDNAETLLLNLIRGSSLRGLGGIPPRRGPFVRPLLGCTRRQVEDYCARQGLEWVEDSSNAGDDYARNRVRHHVLPLLRAENPRLVQLLGEMTRELRADAHCLESLATQEMETLDAPQGGWSRPGFLAMEDSLQRHALAVLLRQRDIGLSRERITGMLETVAAGSGAVQLSARWRLRCNRRMFYLEEERSHGAFAHAVSLMGAENRVTLPISDRKRLDMHWRPFQKNEFTLKYPAKQFKNAVDCDKMGKILNIRPRMPGDRLRPPGSAHSRTLKNLFQEAGIPPARRAASVVVQGEDGGVMWVEGLGPCQDAAVGPDTRRILYFSLLEDDDGV